MPRVTTAAVGTELAMTEAANAVLVKGGTSVDACIAGFFAAAGAHPGALLGSVVMLVAGTGSGAYLFNGSVVQPGKGAPRPRGFVDGDEIPIASRIPVSSTGAFLAAAHAHGGSLPMSELVNAGVKLARAQRANGRANILRRVAAAGPVALREASFVRSLLDVAGRPEGGNITTEDVNDVHALVTQPSLGDNIVHVEVPSSRHACPPLETRVMVACDHRSVLAALHCAFDPDGVELVPHEITASKLAVPVRRGVPRVGPGTPLSLPAPIALLTKRDVPWAAVALDGISPVDWERLQRHLAPDITIEQSLRDLMAQAGPARRALAVVPGARVDSPPRTYDVTSS